jgi:hypothetical protein
MSWADSDLKIVQQPTAAPLAPGNQQYSSPPAAPEGLAKDHKYHYPDPENLLRLDISPYIPFGVKELDA